MQPRKGRAVLFLIRQVRDRFRDVLFVAIASIQYFTRHTHLTGEEYSRLLRWHYRINRVLSRHRSPAKNAPKRYYSTKVMQGVSPVIVWGDGMRQPLSPLHGKAPLFFGKGTELCGGQSQAVSQKKLPSSRSSPPERRMRVLTICSFDHGGAGTGSLRRVAALRRNGVDVMLLTLVSNSTLDYVGHVEPALDGVDVSNQHEVWQVVRDSIDERVMKLSYFRGQEFFSHTQAVLDFRQLASIVKEADIVHLHWAVGMVDYEHMSDVLLDKPVVWTTGDMNPFTGGCHYSEGCEGYKQQCRDCPQLRGRNDLPHNAWTLKKRTYDRLNLSVICPSKHIAKMARSSSLFGAKPVHVIPNAYPVERFQIENRVKSRNELGLPEDKKLVLIGAATLTAFRKGGDLLAVILRKLRRRGLDGEVEVLSFGHGRIDLPIPVHHLGTVEERLLSSVYSAADVYLSVTREDVGPMTVVESLLCGTPVVGFDVGVLPEVGIPYETTISVKPFDINAVSNALYWFLSSPLTEKGRLKCRKTAMRYADPDSSARQHEALYRDLMTDRKETRILTT